MKLAEQLKLSDHIKIHPMKTDLLITDSLKGIYFPQAGAIDMAHYCQWLLSEIAESQLTVYAESPVTNIQFSDHGWQIVFDPSSGLDKVVDANFQHIIDCRGAAAISFGKLNSELDTALDHLHTTAGQTCQFHSPRLAKQVTQVLCGKVYLIPLADDQFILGSSFEDQASSANSNDLLLKPAIQDQLLEKMNQLLRDSHIPPLTDSELQVIPLQGKRAYRLHAQDRLPLVGPAINAMKLSRDFNKLGQKSLNRDELSHYNQPGYWLNTAYGSHGLLFSMLASQHLVSLICGEISPLNTDISHAIHPARFFIRHLKQK
ncbi:MAG: FAD-dependent oxidoreductase [Enterobacterales bacterium]|nr:FAD-dependent oxidoreductase [Enterobacterales bacterium]